MSKLSRAFSLLGRLPLLRRARHAGDRARGENLPALAPVLPAGEAEDGQVVPRFSPQIAERRRIEERLNYLAEHDALTGLANRQAVLDDIEQGIEAGRPLSILFIDVDQFKQVNDAQGHSIGDEVLIAVAGRLLQSAPSAQRLARLGGDEFLCLLAGDGGDGLVGAAAQQILAAFEQPVESAGLAFPLSVSIGICRYPRDGSTVGELLRNADTAMYRAKADGRGHSRFYEASMSDEARHRVRLENLMCKAIRKGEFEMLLQPQVDATSGALCGAEALLCWRSPELGLVLPALFIPLAEENGLIFPLGDWVLREACRQFVEWRAADLLLPEISVNLSACQLAQPGFIDELRAALTASGMAPACLRLELTESVLMRVDDATSRMHALRQLGVTLALDDFASRDLADEAAGHGVFAWLKALPVQQLKIDAAVVHGIGRDLGDETRIRKIIDLARRLALEVVAEGVETPAQADFLRALGCQRLQGFLYGPPVAPTDFQVRWSKPQ